MQTTPLSADNTDDRGSAKALLTALVRVIHGNTLGFRPYPGQGSHLAYRLGQGLKVEPTPSAVRVRAEIVDAGARAEVRVMG